MKKHILLTLWALLMAVPCALARDIVLTDGWILQGKYPATVPSTVMGCLMTNGEYTGILEGMGYKTVDRTRFDVPWWYRTEFKLEDKDLQGHVWLCLDGISYRANVWLNGRKVADKDSLFGTYRRFQIDVTDVVKEVNRLEIEVFRARKAEPNAGYVDWNPRPADESMGIFRPVTIHTCGDVLLDNVFVASHVNKVTLKEASLTVTAHLKNMSHQPRTVKLAGRYEGRSFQASFHLAPLESRSVSLDAAAIPELRVENPRLWWCRNMGKAELYTMDLTANVDGVVSDRRSVTFGIREVGDYYTADGYRGFTLNGRKVLIRGGGWTDDIFMRDTYESNKTQVEYVCDMNLNAIRMENIWGTAQDIFELCDRHGILLLPGWSCQWEWEVYIGKHCDDLYGSALTVAERKLMARYFHDQVLWLRNHPSIICWFVGSDKLPRPELEQEYRELLWNIDPTRPLITSAKKLESTVSGSAGMKMVGPYNYVGPGYWYDSKAPGGHVGFNTETGIGAQLPQKESLVCLLGGKVWPVDSVWNYHCTASDTSMGNLTLLQEVLAARYGNITGFEDFVRKGELANYESTRAMFESFRVNIPHSTGIIQWMLNSARPGVYWQLYDHYMVPTSAYYSVRKGCAPLQLIYDYGCNRVKLVNETLAGKELVAKMRLYDMRGNKIVDSQEGVMAAAFAVKDVFNIPSAQDCRFLFLSLYDTDGQKVAENEYVLAPKWDGYAWDKSDWITTPIDQYADFTSLEKLPLAKCAVKVAKKKDGKGAVLEITLSNSSQTVAFFTRLVMKDGKDKVVVPAFYSDNFFSIPPGDKRVITCHLPDAQRMGKGTTLAVEGWNMREVRVRL